ncbi:TorF family putative porin [Sphingobium sp. JS3065]|uniref:TorF family putative porin n=1 Tax=Sphingobium sp. JS3065 TaxID=2970925 RepID=UPI002263F6F8|nr:TorF family putative porin [Sphingobium sp. JS3065]UZW56707.1 TorF family putative porin [Sphingobium sp. JS3065]
MRKSIALSSAILLASVVSPALAQEAPPSDITISGGATLVSDYRFRGISQTNKRAAVQGTFTVSHTSGFYATVWGSSVDRYIYDNSQEIDLIAGYKHSFGGTTLDVGVLYYYYPNSGFKNSDFAEPYASVSHTLGPVTGKLSAAYAPKQQALSLDNVTKRDSLYIAGDLSAAIPQTPLSLSAHLGRSFNRSYLTFGEKYTDWSVGASYTWKSLTLGVSYVDTNKDLFNGTRNISKAGVVGTIGVAF